MRRDIALNLVFFVWNLIHVAKAAYDPFIFPRSANGRTAFRSEIDTIMGSQSYRPLTDIEYLVTSQMQEMEMVRQKVYSLEQTQLAIKQR